MSSFRLRCLSKDGVRFDVMAEEAYFPAVEGPLGLLPEHAPLVAQMKDAGVLRFKENGRWRYFASFNGVLWLKEGVATLLVDDIQEANTIDLARAKMAKERAEKRLKEKQEGVDLVRAQASLHRALARIEARSLFFGVSSEEEERK